MNQSNQEQDQLANNETENQSNQEQDSAFFYGNKDDDKEHKLPSDWKNKVCVWQCIIQSLGGGIVEVPNTHQLQTYDPASFDKLSADEKGKPSFFSESKMRVKVLHDPRS